MPFDHQCAFRLPSVLLSKKKCEFSLTIHRSPRKISSPAGEFHRDLYPYAHKIKSYRARRNGIYGSSLRHPGRNLSLKYRRTSPYNDTVLTRPRAIKLQVMSFDRLLCNASKKVYVRALDCRRKQRKNVNIETRETRDLHCHGGKISIGVTERKLDEKFCNGNYYCLCHRDRKHSSEHSAALKPG